MADFHHRMDSLAGTRTLAPRLQGMFSTKEGAEGTGSSPHANDVRVRGQGAETAGGGGND